MTSQQSAECRNIICENCYENKCCKEKQLRDRCKNRLVITNNGVSRGVTTVNTIKKAV